MAASGVRAEGIQKTYYSHCIFNLFKHILFLIRMGDFYFLMVLIKMNFLFYLINRLVCSEHAKGFLISLEMNDCVGYCDFLMCKIRIYNLFYMKFCKNYSGE